MTDDSFKIYVEHLRDGQHRAISEKYPADFLDVHEEALTFEKPVLVNGEAYLAGDSLVLHLKIVATGSIPCSICNKPVEVITAIDNFYHAEPLEEIKGSSFDFRDVIREAILVDTPPFAECNDGNCSARKDISKYLKKPEQTADEGYHPFADL